MLEALKSNWNLFRVIRVALGILIVTQGVIAFDTFSIVLGGVFSAMALFNFGCCGVNGCATDYSSNATINSVEEISYEEVVDKK